MSENLDRPRSSSKLTRDKEPKVGSLEGDSLTSTGWKLTLGGTATALGATIIAVVIVWVTVSSSAGFTVVPGAILGLVAMAFSQIVLTLTNKLPEQMTMVLGMGAYGIALLAVLLVLRVLRDYTSLHLLWVAVGLGVGIFGYIIGLIWTYSRLRILVFTPSQPTAPDNHTTSPDQ
ncbi:MAG: hypothetical protein FWF25_04905 [Propionibacteriaceae bacterium]|nr:hypothetical protein [Propionibacteriaceae bacterium]